MLAVAEMYIKGVSTREDVDDFGGCVMPLGDALEFIANEGIFWIWT